MIGGTAEVTTKVPAGFVRIPGLFRRAELEPIDKLEPGFHVMDAGTAPDGSDLVAVYQRDRGARPADFHDAGPISVEITIPDEDSRMVVRYCDVCHRWGSRRSVHLCGVNWHPGLEDLLRELTKEGRAAR